MIDKFTKIRKNTVAICAELSEDEMSSQPVVEVSPVKWHLGHTSWLFEKIILEPFLNEYKCFNEEYNFIFNSYYKQVGKHIHQADRWKIKLDSKEVLEYRNYIDECIISLLMSNNSKEVYDLMNIAISHEEQHQELIHMDIKSVLSYVNKKSNLKLPNQLIQSDKWLEIPEDLYEYGYNEDSFCFDNEKPQHKFFQHRSIISKQLVTNAEYHEFINGDGYKRPEYWLSKGWDWVEKNTISEPLYWDSELNPLSAVAHISYFEADAYANWAGCRLPTEYEHEFLDRVTNSKNDLWAWTSSHYSAYPGFKKFDGVLSEYNGKFMCNQFVLRGGSIATPDEHWRASYRNFYEPHNRWQFSGIRLAKDN